MCRWGRYCRFNGFAQKGITLGFSEDEKAARDRARRMPIDNSRAGTQVQTSKSAKRRGREEGVRSAAEEVCTKWM